MSEQTWLQILLTKVQHVFKSDAQGSSRSGAQEYIDLLGQGVDKWNQWRRQQRQDHYPDLQIDLRNVNLDPFVLEGADLSGANLEKFWCPKRRLKNTDFHEANLQGAYLRLSDLEGADLSDANLSGAFLVMTDLKGANLSRAHLEGADLSDADLRGANLSEVFFDGTSRLGAKDSEGIQLDGVYLADVHWRDVNLAVVNWSSLIMLGEEHDAQRDKTDHAYEKAARANRQLAVALRNQGLNDEATRFAYQAQILQREVFRLRISQWQKRKGAILSLIRTLVSIWGIVTFILGLLLIGIIASIQTQQRVCHHTDPLFSSHNASCLTLLTQLAQLSPTLLVPALLLLGILILSLAPLSYLRQNTRQNLGQILILFLFLLIGFLLMIVPLLLFLPPALQSLGSLLITMDPSLETQLFLFFIIWLVLFLLPSLPWLKVRWVNLKSFLRLGYTLIPLILFLILSLLFDAHRLPLSSLLPESEYMQFFPILLFASPQFPFLLFPLLLFILSTFFPSLQEPRMFKVLWLLLLVVVLYWYLVLATQLQSLAKYLQYYPLPPFQSELFHLGPLAPLVLFLPFLIVQPFIQRASFIQRVRMQVLSRLGKFKNTLANYGQYTLSLFLDALAGYGYKPGRTLAWYVTAILSFAVFYSVVGTISGYPLSWHEALVFSLTSFHGRGFFPGFEELHPLLNPLITLAAFEAVIGLIIEVSFIATFTQRFFGK